jgi:hypothetical protein
MSQIVHYIAIGHRLVVRQLPPLRGKRMERRAGPSPGPKVDDGSNERLPLDPLLLVQGYAGYVSPVPLPAAVPSREERCL